MQQYCFHDREQKLLKKNQKKFNDHQFSRRTIWTEKLDKHIYFNFDIR